MKKDFEKYSLLSLLLFDFTLPSVITCIVKLDVTQHLYHRLFLMYFVSDYVKIMFEVVILDYLKETFSFRCMDKNVDFKSFK